MKIPARTFILIFLFLILLNSLHAQQREIITVIGDSLIGKIVDGETIREVHGNVVLTQGNVQITCNTAIQFIARNDAELIGDVVVTQDSITITTERGFYYGNLRKSESTVGVKLDDKKVNLTAQVGEYFFDEDRAFFRQDVVLYDTVSTLTSDELTYFTNDDLAIAVGNVKIVDKENIIESDSLRHNRKTRVSIADNNVRIQNLVNHVIIYGDHLEDYAEQSFTLIDRNPLLIQIDTTYQTKEDSLLGEVTEMYIDTLLIRSRIMEAYRDTLNLFKAADSVRIIRENFASVNDLTLYYRGDEKIVTYRASLESMQPVLWHSASQLTGDSVSIYLEESRIKQLDVDGNAFILSQSEIFRNRFDQTSGESLKLFFEGNQIVSTEVYGGVLSIYFLYEENEPNGVTKSSSQAAKINFENNEVVEVRLYGLPASEYYPEKQVAGSEHTFFLPAYIFHENRPTKKDLIQNLKIR